MAAIYTDHDLTDAMSSRLGAEDHDILTTRQAGRKRAGDEAQLAYAASLGRILLTHNWRHYLLLQRAWRYWSDLWTVEPRPAHAGILAVPQAPPADVERVVRAINQLIGAGEPLTNRFSQWTPGEGWVRHGLSGNTSCGKVLWIAQRQPATR